MDGDYQFDNLDDEELCDRVRRIDPAVAPLNYAKIKSILESRDYVVQRSENGLNTFVAHELRLNKEGAVSTCNSGNERVDALIDSWKASK